MAINMMIVSTDSKKETLSWHRISRRFKWSKNQDMNHQYTTSTIIAKASRYERNHWRWMNGLELEDVV